jgi:phosphoribosylformylglycinamidine synthase subunit PurSL
MSLQAAANNPSHAPNRAPVHRVEVWPTPGAGDPAGEHVVRRARALGADLEHAATAKVYLIQADLSPDQWQAIQTKLLANPVTEVPIERSRPVRPGSQVIEVHPLPGVMDPAAQSVRESIRALTGLEVGVSTGRRVDLAGLSEAAARDLAVKILANPAIHAIHTTPFHPADLPKGKPYQFKLRHVELRSLSDEQLTRLSRDAHLFLSLDEMKAIQAYYKSDGREPTDIELETLAQTWSEHCVHKTLKSRIRYRHAGTEARRHEGASVSADALPRTPDLRAAEVLGDSPTAPTDPINWHNRPGHTIEPDGTIVIDNLLKSTVAAATFELMKDGADSWLLSVFKDNAGVIAFDDHHAVCVKVETHNHPSAIEPYGGAATGIGGCIRDVIGTGLAAKPIASTDVFCVAHPGSFTAEIAEHAEGKAGQSRAAEASIVKPQNHFALSASSALKPLPPNTLHPRRILTDIVAGVRDYGNRMGIPTVSGGVFFDDRYVGNPLVFCGCIGVMPRHLIKGRANPGDRIIALGGRTGRDGIHGATFSSTELEHTSADEFSHAVQIGNAIEEKRVLDAILRARDGGARDGETERRRDEVAESGNPSCLRASVPPCLPFYSALTDCGAGGFSSAIGEMGSELGAEVHLDRAPLKYDGLSYTEIWISEAQERMILAVPPANLPALQRICDEEGVELADLGHFGTPSKEIVLHYHAQVVGRLGVEFLHEGIPMPTREAVWGAEGTKAQRHEGTKPNAESRMPNAESRMPNAEATQNPELRRASAPGSGSVQALDSSSAPLGDSVPSCLRALLAHPTIASKHWIIRQYDHEVQGNTILKPLIGPAGRGPGDAAIIEPVPGTGRGLAISQGLQNGLGDPRLESRGLLVEHSRGSDPYLMALAAVDECVRNLVCVGADPDRIAILDNFCWPSCQKPDNLARLVRAAEGCYDAAKTYKTPFVSGKDSLNNQLRYTDPATGMERLIEIPPTLLITGIGIVPSIAKAVTMDAKCAGNMLVLLGETTPALGGSIVRELLEAHHVESSDAGAAFSKLRMPAITSDVPRVDLRAGPASARAMHALINAGLVQSAHDCSEGGLLVAIAEMLIASGGTPTGSARDRAAASLGFSMSVLASQIIPGLTGMPLGPASSASPTASATADAEVLAAFAESPSRYVLEISPASFPRVLAMLAERERASGVRMPMLILGTLDASSRLRWPSAGLDEPVESLAQAWQGPLDW